MPPEINGADVFERLGKEFGGMAEDMRRTSDGSKEFAISMQASVNSLGALVEAMHRSRFAFADFMGILEKTSVVAYTAARSISDLSQNIRGATGSVEGLISSVTSLTTRTMPDLVKYIALTSSSYREQIDMLTNEKSMLTENVAHRSRVIDKAERELKVLKEKEYLTDDQITEMMRLKNVIKEETQVRMNESESLTIVTEKLKESKEGMEKFGASLTKALGVITLAITTVVAVAQAYDNAIKAKRETIYTLGRLGVSYTDNIEKAEKFGSDLTHIANKWGMLREEMAKAIAPLTALGVGAGAGGISTLKESAEIAGGMMRGFGLETGITIKALGTLSTSFNLQGHTLGDTFMEIAGHGQKSVLGMQRYITEMTSAIETTRRFGGSTEGSMLMLDSFGEELKKGTITMDNLTRLVAPATWSLQQQGAVAAMLPQFAPNEAKAMGITGKNVLDDILSLQRAAKGNPDALANGMMKLIDKLTPPGSGEGEKAILSQQFLQQLTGVQVPLLDAVKTLTDPEKLKKAMGGGPTPAESMSQNFGKLATNAERLVGSVDTIRDAVLKLAGQGTMVEGVGELFKKDSWSAVFGGGRAQLSDELKMRNITQAMLGSSKAGIQKQYQTGGYIPEDVVAMLHAGESVSRPGEGAGGIRITLGGINITSSGGGDMRGQLDQAFERLKQETIDEIESQWTEAGVSH